MSVIFVAGIHGVGKTTGCEHVAKQLGIAHFTASQIIRSRKVSAIAIEGKIVKDLDENQRILVEGVHQTLTKNSPLLLDGHFTLRTDDGIAPIALSVFKALPIRAVALFHDSPGKIAERISQRDSFALDVAQVSAHQEAELSHAHEIAQSLGIPITLFPAFDTTAFSAAVSLWLKR